MTVNSTTKHYKTNQVEKFGAKEIYKEQTFGGYSEATISELSNDS